MGAVRNAGHMNQRRVRVLPRSESRRGAYTAKLHHKCQFRDFSRHFRIVNKHAALTGKPKSYKLMLL